MEGGLAAAGIAIVAVAVLGGAALLAWDAPAEALDGAFPVHVLGSGGRVVFDARVDVADATALSALEAAAAIGGFTVETREYPGMGTYVVAVDGEAARRSSGWVYEVTRSGEAMFGDRAADRFALEPGDALAWRWSDAAG